VMRACIVFHHCFTCCPCRFADCNGNSADGCEVNTNTDAQNCGGCGVSAPNAASVTCNLGALVINSCNTGYVQQLSGFVACSSITCYTQEEISINLATMVWILSRCSLTDCTAVGGGNACQALDTQQCCCCTQRLVMGKPDASHTQECG
jgi:hypothetical protein